MRKRNITGLGILISASILASPNCRTNSLQEYIPGRPTSTQSVEDQHPRNCVKFFYNGGDLKLREIPYNGKEVLVNTTQEGVVSVPGYIISEKQKTESETDFREVQPLGESEIPKFTKKLRESGYNQKTITYWQPPK